MDDFIFSLDKSRPTKLFYCPSCGKKRFKRYVDNRNNEYLPLEVGRCNREVECGYHYKPNQYFKDNLIHTGYNRGLTTELKRPLKTIAFNDNSIDFIPQAIFEKSVSESNYRENNFLIFLELRFGYQMMRDCAKKYNIGTSKHWPGASVFWQVDIMNRVRTGKIILYDKITGKRTKEPFSHVNWVHTLLTRKGQLPTPYNLTQCLFGEHMVGTSSGQRIVIVESEKTAIVSSIYFPDYTWLACGGLSMLNEKLLLPLKQFPLILYPDLKAAGKWEHRRQELLGHGYKVALSNLLENSPYVKNKERQEGLDLADFLLRAEPPQSQLQKFIRKHPVVKTLVDRLDLGEIPE